MSMNRVWVVVALALLVLAAGCAGAHERTCGNGACENWETYSSCPQDCKPLVQRIPAPANAGSGVANG